MKIGVFSTKSYDQEFFEKFKIQYDFEFTYLKERLNIETVHLATGFEAVCIFVNDKLDEATLKVLSENGVKLVALRCAGYNNVDLDAAKKYNIVVVRVPAYSPESVAEHAVALILTLNRKTHIAHKRVAQDNFSIKSLKGFNLFGKTIGVIGTGKIGAAFIRIMKGFGCEIVAFDIMKSEELIALGVKYLPIEEVFSSSDILSLHCPLTPKTKYLINRDSLKLMKEEVMIINTSRGAAINTRDVIESLKKNEIGAVGLDVYEKEAGVFFEDFSNSKLTDDLLIELRSFPNVLITSHQAFFTEEAMTEITKTTLDSIDSFNRKTVLINALN